MGVDTAELRVALVGAGHVSGFHLRAWRSIVGARVVAIVDPDEDAARRRGAEFGIDRYYRDVADAAASTQIDALDIVSPPQTHFELVRYAIENGLQVVSQKPLCPEFEDAVALYRLERDAPVTVMVHDNWRFRPWYRQLQSMLADGVLGDVFYLSSSSRFAGTIRSSAYPDIPFSLSRQPYFGTLERFLLLESAIHQIDAIRYLIGDPETVYARAHSISDQVRGEDAVSLVLGYPGITANVDRSYASHSLTPPPVLSERLLVEGSKGSAMVDKTGNLTIVRDLPSGREVRTHTAPADSYQRSYDAALQHFVRAVRGEEVLEQPISDALRTLSVVFSAYRSIDARTVVNIPEFQRAHGLWEPSKAGPGTDQEGNNT